jgi:hypothetical protein
MITHYRCIAQLWPCDEELFVCIVSHRQCVHLHHMCQAHFAFSTAIKFRPSHLAVDLAHRLVKELQLKPDRYTQLCLDKAEQPQKDRLATSSSRMMGTSRSIPRSSQAEWCHPLTAGAGGNPPSIPRPNKTPTTGARHIGPDCEFMMDPLDDGAGQPPAGLLWNFPRCGYGTRPGANAHGQWRSRARTLNAWRELELHTILLPRPVCIGWIMCAC